jgi:hypothetical protein
MGVETVLLGSQGPSWQNLNLKPNCAPRYFPISHDWPAAVEGDLAWGPTSFGSEDDFTLTLTESEVAEVKCGLEHFNSTIRSPQLLGTPY